MQMDAINGGSKKRRRAALVEQEEKLSSAEREYMEGKGHLGAIMGQARQIETRRRLKLDLLQNRYATLWGCLPLGCAPYMIAQDGMDGWTFTVS
jgi:hypothetical protein